MKDSPTSALYVGILAMFLRTTVMAFTHCQLCPSRIFELNGQCVLVPDPMVAEDVEEEEEEDEAAELAPKAKNQGSYP